MVDFLKALHSDRVLLMDGAMGTELQRAGIGSGECYELWNLTHPDRVRAIHGAYQEAGAEVFLTNTFQANPGRFSQLGISTQLAPVATAAVALARAVARDRGYVLYDVGPFPEEWRRPAAGAAIYWTRGWVVDALLVETASDIADVARILKARSRSDVRRSSLPVLFSWTFRRKWDGSFYTVTGHSPAGCAKRCRRLDIAALGVNCGRDIGIADTAEIVRQFREHTDLPVFARPNAGTPQQIGDRWVYPHSPSDMAAQLPVLLAAGVCMVGGCCGTTPAHIAAFRSVIDQWNAGS
jgi:5-methyltetrahydrofolate--homocysteine methyltransferase